MKPFVAVIFMIFVFDGYSSGARAAAAPTFSFAVARAPHPMALDPAMNDPAWGTGKVPSVSPWENVTTRSPAAESTSAYVLYDDTNLYVGFVAQQASTPIVATQATNDVGFGTDDFVGIGIDSSGAGSQAYFFETTPRGVRYQQATENVRFRPLWRSAAKVDGSTWRAVMAIPLDVMRLRPAATQAWRIGFFRSIAARAEHLSWGYDPIMQDLGAGNWPTFNDLRFWPHATGIALNSSAFSKPKPRLEVFGLSSSGGDRDLYQQANGTFQPERTRSVGADLSYPITATVNFVGTANPDFSNVEIDQQTIAPQEFARQLAEYRPFFAQGAQYLNPSPAGYTNFNAPQNEVFYSPGVGPFDSGAKVEGTYGLQSFGALTFRGFNDLTGEAFDDQAVGFHHALPDQTFQYWADGVLAHHSIAGTDNTYEFGARVRNLANGLLWQFDSDIEDGALLPNGVAHSTNSAVDVHKANYEAIFQYADISPEYDPLDGFTTISDIRGPSGYLNLTGSTPGVKNWSFFVQGDRLLDRSGAVHQADSNVFFNAVFKDGFSVNGLGPSTSELREYDGNFFTGYPSYANGKSVPFNLMAVPIGFHDGTPAPIDVSANWGSFGGNWLHLYTTQASRPIGSRLTLGLEYDGSYERAMASGDTDSQWLRRLSLGFNMGASSNLTLALRDINGHGGFSDQLGLNLAAAYHARTKDGDLYVNFGSPSASSTLNRLIVKYVLRFGADAGT